MVNLKLRSPYKEGDLFGLILFSLFFYKIHMGKMAINLGLWWISACLFVWLLFNLFGLFNRCFILRGWIWYSNSVNMFGIYQCVFRKIKDLFSQLFVYWQFCPVCNMTAVKTQNAPPPPKKKKSSIILNLNNSYAFFQNLFIPKISKREQIKEINNGTINKYLI